MQRYIETIQNPERKIFLIMAAILLSLFALYGYFLNTAIMRVVAREAAMNTISQLDTRLSELEFTYIEKQNSIDIELAYERNFVNVAPPVFVSRGTGRNLTLLSRPGDL